MSFLDKLKSKVKEKQSNPVTLLIQYLIENCVMMTPAFTCSSLILNFKSLSDSVCIPVPPYFLVCEHHPDKK